MNNAPLMVWLIPPLFVFSAHAAIIFAASSGNTALDTARLCWALFIASLFFMSQKTQKAYIYRAVFFIITAWSFMIRFRPVFGSLKNIFYAGESVLTPYCHISQSSTLLNILRNIYLAFASADAALWLPLSAGALWLAATLILGRGFCSWGCFFGGLDEGFSLANKTKFWVKKNIPQSLRNLPSAILLFSLIISFTAGVSFFCLWICPLKTTCSFLNPEPAIRLAQTVLFTAVGLIFIIILPLLLKKRAFCAYICPFGAWQSLAGGINPFKLKVDKQLCNLCLKCVEACPTNVINKPDLNNSKISSYCNLCLKCVEACPQGAIRLSFLGRHTLARGGTPAHLKYLFDIKTCYSVLGFLFGGSISMIFVPDVLLKLVRYFL